MKKQGNPNVRFRRERSRMIYRECGLLTGFFLMAALPATAHAEVSAAARCNQVAAKLQASFWDQLRSAADQTVCRKPWVERSPGEFSACATTDLSLKFNQAVKDKWNAYFAANGSAWATWGPRAIGSATETGSIQGGFKRTYLGAGLPETTSVVVIRKTGGRAEGKISICEIDENRRVIRSHRREFANGQGNIGQSITVSIPNSEVKTIGVVVDTAAGLNSFSYSTALRTDFGPVGPRVDGLADLHIHQLADRGFGGRTFWGEHRGSKSTVLQAEQTSPGPQNLAGVFAPATPGLPGQPLTNFQMDANIVMAATTLKDGQNLGQFLIGNGSSISSWSNRDEDGFFQVGGGGAPDYDKWPHHADRSHHQAHIDWLQKAHDEGLNLIVVSMVNSPFLCNALKALDAYGNVPRYASDGRIIGWESATWNCDTKANVDRQIAAAHALERDFDWYEIALNPTHARKIIGEGKLAVVLSVESDGVLNDESGAGNFANELQRLRRNGVSTIQIVHERDSRFCGAAPHRNEMEFIQRLRFRNPGSPGTFATLLVADMITGTSAFNRDANGRNTLGLTSDGRALVDLMISEGMPVDIAHASVKCRNDVFNRIETRHGGMHGIYDSHTKFEKLVNPDDPGNRAEKLATRGSEFIPAGHEREEEFLITEDIIGRYRQHNVLVGLRTAPVDIYTAPPRSDGLAGVQNICPGSSRSYAQLVDYATSSGLDIAFGSDFNGMVGQMGTRFGPDRCYAANVPDGQASRIGPEPATLAIVRPKGKGSVRGEPVQSVLTNAAPSVQEIDGQNYYRDGLVSVAWLPELYKDLRALGTPGVNSLGQSAEAYIQMWERATGQR